MTGGGGKEDRMDLRSRLAAPRARPLTGPFLSIPAPMVVEIACAAAPDFVCIDLEHGAISVETGENMLRAAAAHGVPALVRVPGPEAEAIGQALDWGAAGVLVPRIATAAQARAVVEAARFPPEGQRGAGPGRASGYGRAIPAMIEAARRQTLVALQVETLAALENLAEILAVPGVDLIFVGPGDLGLGLAAAGRGAELPAAISGVLDSCAKAGRPAGIFVMRPGDLAAYAGKVALAIVGSDTTVLVEGLDRNFGRAE